MALYINNNLSNVETFSTRNSDGTIQGKVGKITPGENIEATDMGASLKIISPVRERDRYVRDIGFSLQTSIPPPPSTSGHRTVAITISEDGWQTVTANIVQPRNAS